MQKATTERKERGGFSPRQGKSSAVHMYLSREPGGYQSEESGQIFMTDMSLFGSYIKTELTGRTILDRYGTAR
jgi:hypothetical protein